MIGHTMGSFASVDFRVALKKLTECVKEWWIYLPSQYFRFEFNAT